MKFTKIAFVIKNPRVINGYFDETKLPNSFPGFIDDHFCNALECSDKCTHRFLLEGLDVYGNLGFICDCGQGFRNKTAAQDHFTKNIVLSELSDDFINNLNIGDDQQSSHTKSVQPNKRSNEDGISYHECMTQHELIDMEYENNGAKERRVEPTLKITNTIKEIEVTAPSISKDQEVTTQKEKNTTHKSSNTLADCTKRLPLRQRMVLRALFELHPIKCSKRICDYLMSKYDVSDTTIRNYKTAAKQRKDKKKIVVESESQRIINRDESIKRDADKLYKELMMLQDSQVKEMSKHSTSKKKKKIKKSVVVKRLKKTKTSIVINKSEKVNKRKPSRIKTSQNCKKKTNQGKSGTNGKRTGVIDATKRGIIPYVQIDTQNALKIMACLLHEYGITDDEGYLESCAAFLELEETQVLSFVAEKKWLAYDKRKFTKHDRKAALELHTDVMECMKNAWQSTMKMSNEELLETKSSVNCTCGQCVFCMLKI